MVSVGKAHQCPAWDKDLFTEASGFELFVRNQVIQTADTDAQGVRRVLTRVQKSFSYGWHKKDKTAYSLRAVKWQKCTLPPGQVVTDLLPILSHNIE